MKCIIDGVPDTDSIKHVVVDDDLYRKGVNDIPSYLCKGLEYDAVLVYGADEGHYHTGRDEKLLYTLCNRALHRLTVYYNDRLTSIIKGIKSELYEHIEG